MLGGKDGLCDLGRNGPGSCLMNVEAIFRPAINVHQIDAVASKGWLISVLVNFVNANFYNIN